MIKFINNLFSSSEEVKAEQNKPYGYTVDWDKVNNIEDVKHVMKIILKNTRLVVDVSDMENNPMFKENK